jgi:hypothetical protein
MGLTLRPLPCLAVGGPHPGARGMNPAVRESGLSNARLEANLEEPCSLRLCGRATVQDRVMMDEGEKLAWSTSVRRFHPIVYLVIFQGSNIFHPRLRRSRRCHDLWTWLP